MEVSRVWGRLAARFGGRPARSASQRRQSHNGNAGPHPATVSGCLVTEFGDRRAALMRTLPAGSLAIFPAASKTYMARDIPYPFHQDSDFRYFSGFAEPDAVLLVRSDRTSAEQVHTTLIVPARNPSVELWDGAMTEVADVPAIYGVDSSESMEHLTAVLQAEIASSDTVFLEPRKAFPQSTRFMVNKVVTDTVVKKLGGTVSGLNRQVDSLRAVKSEAEVALISTACQQATEAIHMAMLASRPGVTEHELSAVVDYGCRLHGAVGPSFPAVVAGGPRALTLHYHPSADGPAVDDGDMVLMDFGASHLGYASDISRTWPIAGKYSAPQRELYDAVLRTQQQCIDMCTADGTMSLSQIQQSSMLFTAQELIKLGILKADDVAGANGAHLVRQFYPHSIGHYLGMDVHDVPSCPLNRPLAPGMVVTIEPGLYIPDTPDVPARFRGLGIRIEDDVLVTEDGPRVLTAGCVKSPDEVEHKLQGQV